MKFSCLAVFGLALCSTAVLAQSGPPPHETSTQEPSASTSRVTPDEIERFASLSVRLQAIENDDMLDAEQKQAAKLVATREAGLSAERYDELTLATRNNPEIRRNVEAAIARQSGPSPADRAIQE